MSKNISKSVAVIAVAAGVLATACTHSTRTPLNDPYRAGKERRDKGSNAEASTADPSARGRRDRTGPSEIRPRWDGSTMESEVPELADVQAAVAKHPKDTARRLKLAMLYHHYGLYDRASEEYHAVLDRDPKDAQAYERLGKLWLDWGVSDRALGALEKALALRPDFVEAYNTLGLVYDARGEYERSQKAYQQALAINPNLDYVYNNLCYSYSRSGKFPQAVAACRAALRINPQNQTAYNNLGYALGMLDDYAGAYRAFAAGGHEALAHNNLGIVLQTKNRYREAQAEFKKALGLNPNYRSAAENYAALAAVVSADPPTPTMTAGPPAGAPSSADAVVISRQAEEKLLDTLAERLRLRVLSNQAESYSFNPDSPRLSPPTPGGPTRLTPARLQPVLAPGAMELRPVTPRPEDATRPVAPSVAVGAAPVTDRRPDPARPADFARMPVPRANAASGSAPAIAPSALRPDTLELRPAASLSARAPLHSPTVRPEESAGAHRPLSHAVAKPDFARVVHAPVKNPDPPAPRAATPVTLSAAMELRPVHSLPIHGTATAAVTRDGSDAAALVQTVDPAHPAPARFQPVLSAHTMELSPVTASPVRAPQHGSAMERLPNTTALAQPAISSGSSNFAKLGRAWPSPSPADKGDAPVSAFPVPGLRPVAPLSEIAPEGLAPYRTGGDADLQAGRVPEFPAQLIIQAIEPTPSAAPEWAAASDPAPTAAGPVNREPYRFQLGMAGHRESPAPHERVLVQYTMSGPLRLPEWAVSSESATRPSARRRLIKSAARELLSRPTEGRTLFDTVGPPAVSPAMPDAGVSSQPSASTRVTATYTGNPTVSSPSPRRTGLDRRGRLWVMSLALLLLSIGGFLYHFRVRGALKKDPTPKRQGS